jgi:CDP-diacylglycerol---serine O-phosphatidyltransferase
MNNTPPRPRGIYLLPNLFTIGALFAGFFAIISAFKGSCDQAAIAIFLAMILDSLDGRVARLTNTMTNFGAEFDSLSDMVAFAIAPALLAYSWNLSSLGKFGWIAAFIYAVAVALRLARFNTQVSTAGKKYFQGLPCPAGAAIVASLVWICFDYTFTNQTTIWFLALTMIVVATLMVSNIRYYSFKEIEFKNNVRFVVILIVVLIIALVSIDPGKVLLAIFASYAISGPIATIWGLKQKKRLRKSIIKHE